MYLFILVQLCKGCDKNFANVGERLRPGMCSSNDGISAILSKIKNKRFSAFVSALHKNGYFLRTYRTSMFILTACTSLFILFMLPS